MPHIVGEIKRHGVPKVIKEEVTGDNMTALITSIKAVKEAMNELLSTIVVEEAGASVTSKAQSENAAPVEEDSSEEPEESGNDTTKKRQKLK